MTNLFFPLDVDECRTTCMKDTQQCINSQGSYNCKCKAGYEKKNGAADDECTKGKSLSFRRITHNTSSMTLKPVPGANCTKK